MYKGLAVSKSRIITLILLLPHAGCGAEPGATMCCAAGHHHRLLRHHLCYYWHIRVSSAFLGVVSGRCRAELWFLYISTTLLIRTWLDVTILDFPTYLQLVMFCLWLSTLITVLCCLPTTVVHLCLMFLSCEFVVWVMKHGNLLLTGFHWKGIA